MLRVLVCDEYPLFRRQAVIALEQAPDVEVVAEAPDLDVARGVAEQTAPDVAVVGTHVPPRGGVAAIRVLRELIPAVEVVLAVDPDDERDERALQGALRAGALAFVSRDAVAAHGLAVVRSAAAHRPVLDPVLARLALVELRALAEADPARLHLTAAEREVLELLASGRGITDSAEALGVPVPTASNTVANALRKLERASPPTDELDDAGMS